MQTTPSVQKKSPRMLAIVFVSAGLALVLTSGFSLLASWNGLLFSGISTLFTVFVATVVCIVVTSLAAFVIRKRNRRFGWRALVFQVSVLAFVTVVVLSWLDTRQGLKIFISPSPVPYELRVHHGRSILFSSYVHFSGPPVVIASLLKSKGLIEVPADPPETSDMTGFSAREESKLSWDWWQPSTMSKPRFFFLHHTSEAVQGWSEGWWVSGETNDVYAFISG